MKRKNMISMVTSLALVGVVAVGGTLALLTSQSNDVTNTFTVGKGYNDERPDLKLDEADVDQVVEIDPDDATKNIGDYVENDNARVEGNNYTNLVEDAKMAKDPQFHIHEDCEVKYSWIVAKVEGFNTFEEGRSGTTLEFTKVFDTTEGDEVNGVVNGSWYKVTKNSQTNAYEFDEVTEIADMNNGVYIYNKPLMAGQSTEDLFQQLKVENFVAGAAPSTITVSGCAVEGVYSTIQQPNPENPEETVTVYEPVDFDNMKDKVMTQVNNWAFGAPAAGQE